MAWLGAVAEKGLVQTIALHSCSCILATIKVVLLTIIGLLYVLQVFISEPYAPENCKSLHSEDTATLDRVIKIVSF